MVNVLSNVISSRVFTSHAFAFIIFSYVNLKVYTVSEFSFFFFVFLGRRGQLSLPSGEHVRAGSLLLSSEILLREEDSCNSSGRQSLVRSILAGRGW